MRQRPPFALRARRQQELPRAARESERERRDVVRDQPHHVADREHRRHRSARGVDPQGDVGCLVLRREREQLRRDQRAVVVIERPVEHEHALVEQLASRFGAELRDLHVVCHDHSVNQRPGRAHAFPPPADPPSAAPLLARLLAREMTAAREILVPRSTRVTRAAVSGSALRARREGRASTSPTAWASAAIAWSGLHRARRGDGLGGQPRAQLDVREQLRRARPRGRRCRRRAPASRRRRRAGRAARTARRTRRPGSRARAPRRSRDPGPRMPRSTGTTDAASSSRPGSSVRPRSTTCASSPSSSIEALQRRRARGPRRRRRASRRGTSPHDERERADRVIDPLAGREPVEHDDAAGCAIGERGDGCRGRDGVRHDDVHGRGAEAVLDVGALRGGRPQHGVEALGEA